MKSIKESPLVSVVANATTTVCTEAKSCEVLRSFRNSNGLVAEIRRLFSDTKEEALLATGNQHEAFKAAKLAVTDLKKKLNAVMWSGKFAKRGKEALVMHSGLLVADLDELEPAVMADARGKLIQDPHVWALFTSPTDSGLKVVYRVPADPTRHLDSFRSIQEHVRQLCGLEVDESGKDLARLCFFSHDPDAYLNESATELEPVRAPLVTTSLPPPGSAHIANRKEIASEILFEIAWTDEQSGFCRCPGVDLHSAANGPKDCRVRLDGAPTVFCLHNSCRGEVERVNAELRSRIGKAERERRQPLTPAGSSTVTDGDEDELIRRFGAPYFVDDNGKLKALNESYWAGLYAKENVILFEPDEKQFYRYNELSGIYEVESADAITAEISARLLSASRSMQGAQALERKRTATTLGNIVKHLRGQVECRGAFTRQNNTIHLANGVIVFSRGDFQLVPFSPNFRARNRSPIRYDPSARCDRFRNELLNPAVTVEDAELIQKFAGMMLIGDNRVQRILILDGKGGRGKTQLANVLQALVGMPNVTQLRTRHLGDRFETFRFLKKSLLVGVDVEPDFLSTRGAAVLKGLVGGDWFDAEQKGGTGSFQIQGKFNVLIVSNTRLRVRLEGDVSAWRRRLTIVRYECPPPARKVPDFGRFLIETEGSGIINWALEGARKLLAEVPDTGGDLVLSTRQMGVVDSLLAESESLQHFLKERLVRDDHGDLTVSEIVEAYAAYCPERGWRPMPMTEVQSSLDGLMLELFGVTKRHDLKREGQKALRGYARVSLSSDVSDGVNQVGTEREGPTERFSDASDGSFLSSREKEKKPGREEASTHKEALKEASVPSDHDPWVATAISINSHLFDVESADRSTRESWRIGLRSNPHPAAKAAMLKLGEE